MRPPVSCGCARHNRLRRVALGSGASLAGPAVDGGPRRIRRDTFGIPHILADDEEAAGSAFGSSTAEDHAAERPSLSTGRGEASGTSGRANSKRTRDVPAR